ncbi:nitronate monooxygenase [Dokdonella sp.]|uniref:NAD(P)H-dependent flavin oxidoreductase n=1 Tax=Dokdonella sp. TaxID=2291710 RepID=UPI0026123A0A|nr:nitronate monooxygenase [Dokdonella sp.]
MIETLFRIERPVVQAPMAGVQGSALAIAVCEGGGLGSLPCAMLSADVVRTEVAAIRARSDRPFNLNFFCYEPPRPDAAREAQWRALLAPYYREAGLDPAAAASAPARKPFDDEAAALVEELRPPVVSFHFGLPAAPLLARVRAAGARILSSATTVAEARWLEARGVDAIVAQGLEAGGHRGHFLSRDLLLQGGLFALLPRMVQAVDVPVIAAGGVADARGVEAALALGAAGVQVGTAYLLCPEATTRPAHRAALKDTDAPTMLTNLFSGGAARGIVNRLMRELGPMRAEAPEFPLASSALAPLRAWAEASGSGDFSPLWAGQNTLGCREISAAELTRELAPH